MRKYLCLGMLFCLLSFYSAKTCPATSVEFHSSKNSVLGTWQHKYSALLFSQQISDSTKGGRIDSIRFKDPNMALFYAAVPGLIIHGAGHFYARKTGTGFILLGCELIGSTLIVGGSLTGWGSPSPSRGGFAVALTGGLIFFGSWIYDMVKSPTIIEKQNEEMLKKRNMGLKFEQKEKKSRLVFVYQF